MKLPGLAILSLLLTLPACGSDAEPDGRTSEPAAPAVVPGVSWSGHGIRFKHPEGMLVTVDEEEQQTQIEIIEEPTGPSSVSLSLYLDAKAPGGEEPHRKRATGAREGLESRGAVLTSEEDIEREIAGKTRKGTALEFDFGPAHYRLEFFSILLGDRMVEAVLRHEPHEKEIAQRAFETVAKTLEAL